MVLSRFWLAIFISSIFFIVLNLFNEGSYSTDYILNGKKEDPILVSEKYLNQLPKFVADSIKKAPEMTMVVNKDTLNADTTYVYKNQTVKLYSGFQKADGLLPTCKNSLVDLILPLIAYLAFFCGLMELLIISGASEKLAKKLSPFFAQVFPSVPKNHESISYMTLNFAANFLGLDSAATPFGLKAMESLQTLNPDKDKASDAQIMFMCLHAAGLTLIPTSIIGYRAAENASNPADVMLPCIITSFIGTIAALLIVGIRQRINFKSVGLLSVLMGIIGAILGLLFYINTLDLIGKNAFTGNLSGLMLISIIGFTLVFSFIHEKRFTLANTTIFDTFVEGARNGLNTGVKIFPYVMGMLVAISFFRNSGLFEIVSNSIRFLFGQIGISKEITDGLPVALLRPFSSGGSRGFMIDAMRTSGVDSFTGRLVCIFQCSAETTFYVIAVYFGSVNIKNTRYTLGTMLLVDFICVLAAIAVATWFF
ncbi:spore maturation protein [Flavobacterium columnare]|uniref:Nucleoside recognition domain-containing protein n=2 Tax=Flavobacterium columnare TaxID=996 RepID=G8XAL1_FLACA|nr:nucleoside recognition domain-containing protein [Flavobacterium columnare]AEW86682.1 nucleoside recognition domain-containing protein [Flavobacterium columnare ATCC 49512]AMO20569.1 spore maturation protein [Flavobacterium columnare]ANO47093.1 nucleoside recognition domain-containing protein [Flavobacterium columnare]APT22218.1 spore maturation protein [Flavobacterium columnare]AUX18542.1 spore maturation protein [Flavobacterium columnare]